MVENNDISFNNPDNKFRSGNEAGGTKFAKMDGLIVRGNEVHNNKGPGLWTDIDNRNVLYEGNYIYENRNGGIFHEISYNAIIRNNRIERNGLGQSNWLYNGGILIAHSSDVEVYNNTLKNNRHGIIGIQQERNRSGVYWKLKNLNVHDNIIEGVEKSLAGIGQSSGAFDAGLDAYNANNRFNNNTYGQNGISSGSWFVYKGSKTLNYWQNTIGFDKSFSP